VISQKRYRNLGLFGFVCMSITLNLVLSQAKTGEIETSRLWEIKMKECRNLSLPLQVTVLY
jgi:hypothetical protein